MHDIVISICIPCYNNVNSLRRLLNSIQIQTFKNVEVIITDDSPNDSVKNLVHEFADVLPITYLKNETSLGSPENWNKAIECSNGTWIKIMHHDDWFTDENSLQYFADQTKSNKQFIFCNYINVFEETGRKDFVRFPKQKMKALIKHPEMLIANNIIGNPSCTMIHHSLKQVHYDRRLIWQVDLEYYMNLISRKVSIHHIDKPLITVGMIPTQITRSVKLNPAVEIPEGYILLEKYGHSILNNIFVYDAYWRMFRNMQILNLESLKIYNAEDWGKSIEHMLKSLSRCKVDKLQKGWYSKIKMLFSYLSRPGKN